MHNEGCALIAPGRSLERNGTPGRARFAAARVALALLCAACAGCVTTVALDRAVIAYDATTADSISKELLLNIARARHNEPIHFTAVSNIAATYKVSVSAGVGPAMTGSTGSIVVPFLGAAAEENPTISISPMQGEEFTQRLLTPFEEWKVTLLLRQGYDVDALLRLLGAEVRLKNDKSEYVAYTNRPSDGDGYRIYRRVMAQLSSIQDRHALYVEPLHFNRVWILPAAAVTPETYQSTYKDLTLTYDEKKNIYEVSKRVNGRVMITNYDPDILPNEERVQLHAEAEQAPPNEILVDIREGHIGGEYPIHGRIRLRSFHEVLTFIGRGIQEEPEYDVPPDPRTPIISENPTHALEVIEAKSLPPDSGLSVSLNGYQYALRPQSGYQWNRKAFSILYQLFQMSVSGVSQPGPEITISK